MQIGSLEFFETDEAEMASGDVQPLLPCQIT